MSSCAGKNSLNPYFHFVTLFAVVLINLVLGLGFLVFVALVLSVMSRVNCLSRQADRLLAILAQAEQDEHAPSSETPQ